MAVTEQGSNASGKGEVERELGHVARACMKVRVALPPPRAARLVGVAAARRT